MSTISTHLTRALAWLALAVAAAGCTTPPTDASFYRQRNLVSSGPAVPAEHTDPNLVNGWGVAFNPFGVVWVSDERTGLSTLYDGNGVPQTLVVRIPPAVAGQTGTPTGIVFYGGPAFAVSNGSVSAPARFIFASRDGTISGWAPSVNLNNAIQVVDNHAAGSLYTGLALGAGGTGPLLYAADFRNARIDVFNAAFAAVALPGTPFVDPGIPAGYAPYGLQAINGDIYVTWARQNAARDAADTGKGLGYVSVFDPNGAFVRRFASRGALNAPWGLALAPDSFGHHGGRLLVGNAGDGEINAYDPWSGLWVGKLRGLDRKPIRIDGLWGLQFGNGLSNQPTNTLFFAAGPDGGAQGLYGRLDAAGPKAQDGD
jgi:uncharacterized protein (TIGR03118 family)